MTLHIGSKTQCYYHDGRDDEPVTEENINTLCTGDPPYNNLPYCEGAVKILLVKFPQGWSYYAGDTCQHGVYTGGCGVDHMCGECEMGE